MINIVHLSKSDVNLNLIIMFKPKPGLYPRILGKGPWLKLWKTYRQNDWIVNKNYRNLGHWDKI